MSLTKCEVKGVNPGIEELDLERTICYWTFLSDELIQTRLSNFALSVRIGVSTAVFTCARRPISP